MKIKALLIDDEKRAIDALSDLLFEYKEIEVSGSFINPMEALEQCNKLEFNVVFLDIEMPGMQGLEVAQKLLEMNEALEIIFVSAHNQYVVKAAALNPLDFLLKPVSRKRMDRVIEKWCKKYDLQIKQN